MNEIEDLLSFAEMLNSLRKVKRAIRSNGEKRWENDVEHSYQLAMLAWYVVRTLDLQMDLGRVLRYALAHDLIEVYAGDTYLFSTDKKLLGSKTEREEKARNRLIREFPALTDIHESIGAYMNKADEESRFVYALDKLQPVINIYLDQGRTWREQNVSLRMIEEAKFEKVKLSPEVKVYYDLLMNLLVERKEELFPKDAHGQAL